MIVGASAVELDAQCVAIVADRTNCRTANWNHAHFTRNDEPRDKDARIGRRATEQVRVIQNLRRL